MFKKAAHLFRSAQRQNGELQIVSHKMSNKKKGVSDWARCASPLRNNFSPARMFRRLPIPKTLSRAKPAKHTFLNLVKKVSRILLLLWKYF